MTGAPVAHWNGAHRGYSPRCGGQGLEARWLPASFSPHPFLSSPSSFLSVLSVVLHTPVRQRLWLQLLRSQVAWDDGQRCNIARCKVDKGDTRASRAATQEKGSALIPLSRYLPWPNQGCVGGASEAVWPSRQGVHSITTFRSRYSLMTSVVFFFVFSLLQRTCARVWSRPGGRPWIMLMNGRRSGPKADATGKASITEDTYATSRTKRRCTDMREGSEQTSLLLKLRAHRQLEMSVPDSVAVKRARSAIESSPARAVQFSSVPVDFASFPVVLWELVGIAWVMEISCGCVRLAALRKCRTYTMSLTMLYPKPRTAELYSSGGHVCASSNSPPPSVNCKQRRQRTMGVADLGRLT